MATKVREFENKGLYYLNQIIKEGWTVTPTYTDDEYSSYDATVSNGNVTYTVENKVRYNAGNYEAEGLLLDAKKYQDKTDYFIEYIPKDGKAYIITSQEIKEGLEKGLIKKDSRKCNKTTFTEQHEKVEKNNYIIPLCLFTVRTIF